nr:prolyl oligopeptidase family serine peptidase [Pseudobutyrivibrio sp.]
ESFNYAALAEDSEADPTQHINATTDRTVVDAYTCDENGNKSDSSEYVALELAYDPNVGNPFCYDILTWHNTVCDPYQLEVTLNSGSSLKDTSGNEFSEVTIDSNIDLSLDAAIYPQLENVDLSGSYTGENGQTLTYGSFAPEDDGNKHPLVIWLHGAGEGGTQNEIAVLGNKVTALYEDEFQNTMGGAYVLTPQTDTFWLTYNEEGDWQGNPGVDSIYLETLKGLIDDYVAKNENIDTNRIYIGGCSNGGYMTMDMILNYPDYFAAAFPICEAYQDSGITDEQLEGIKDLPVWFVYAKNDTTVIPEDFEIPTIKRLESIGADVHTSVFDDVPDTTGRFTGEDGEAYQYMGHWSWIYFFNNQCQENGVNLWNWLTEQSK